jgi:hypothetical protein
MPIRQYFVWVGSVLLLALFAADWYPLAPFEHSHSEIPPNEQANLRIRSEHKWPERVVLIPAHSSLLVAEAAHPRQDSMSTRSFAFLRASVAGQMRISRK